MKIYFRYLFMRLLQPFALCMAACTVIWIMADLYGNMDDFLDHKVNLLLVTRFYILQIPKMLVVVLPAAVLFCTLFTLLSLNRRSELIALQSGGMSPLWLFSPFCLFAVIWVIILGIDLSGPAAQAEITRQRLLKQVKGQDAHSNELVNLPYVDRVNRRVWFFQSLQADQGKAHGVEMLQRDADGHDMVKYFAREAKWNGEFWRLSGVLKIVFGMNGSVQDQKTYEELDLPDVNTLPKQLSLIVSQPEQLTLSQLSTYIATSTSTPEHLAGYRTEWWYRVLYPFSLIVMLFFALLQGTNTDRRSAVGGVVWAIVVFLVYTAVIYVFISAGKNYRLPPFLSVIITEVIFGGIGLHLLALQNGWWWQLREFWKKFQAEWLVEEKEEAGEAKP